MLHGFEWGLYFYNSHLVRAKISADKNMLSSIEIQTIEKGPIMAISLPLNKESALKFTQIDFPEDPRFEGFINRRHYKSGSENVELIQVTTDEEYGGIFAEVSSPDLPPFQRKFIELKEFLAYYDLVKL